MRAGLLGHMATLRAGHKLVPGVPWALDNGLFSEHPWTDDEWFRKLDRHPVDEHCLFVVVPDVFKDAKATDELWGHYAPMVRERGYRPAYVTQNGCTEVPADAPVIFTGGDDAWKLGAEAHALVQKARARGVHTHCGRVNTLNRLKIAVRDGYDTADGTCIAWGPDVNLPIILRFLRRSHEDRLPGFDGVL